MPSFASIAIFALGVLSASSPALARTHKADLSARGIDFAEVANEHVLAKRRPNHADEYGYPHNRNRYPPGAPRQKMRPGGYMDPRPANAGAKCRTNAQCSTAVKYAAAKCVNGACSYQCLSGLTDTGSSCSGAELDPKYNPRCQYNRQCTTGVANAAGICNAGRCSFSCNAGFRISGSTCVPEDAECGGKTCPSVAGGFNTCSNGACTPGCPAYLGSTLHTDGNGNYTCVNTANDPKNCGTQGTTCPGGYNGKGRAFCRNGQCMLSCYRLTKMTASDGSQYCS